MTIRRFVVALVGMSVFLGGGPPAPQRREEGHGRGRPLKPGFVGRAEGGPAPPGGGFRGYFRPRVDAPPPPRPRHLVHPLVAVPVGGGDEDVGGQAVIPPPV